MSAARAEEFVHGGYERCRVLEQERVARVGVKRQPRVAHGTRQQPVVGHRVECVLGQLRTTSVILPGSADVPRRSYKRPPSPVERYSGRCIPAFARDRSPASAEQAGA